MPSLFFFRFSSSGFLSWFSFNERSIAIFRGKTGRHHNAGLGVGLDSILLSPRVPDYPQNYQWPRMTAMCKAEHALMRHPRVPTVIRERDCRQCRRMSCSACRQAMIDEAELDGFSDEVHTKNSFTRQQAHSALASPCLHNPKFPPTSKEVAWPFPNILDKEVCLTRCEVISRRT
jgi:hypothetical protein